MGLATAHTAEARGTALARLPRSARSALSGMGWPLRYGAMLALACLLSAATAWWAATSFEQTALVERDVLAAHVRGLLQDSPIQVASSDAHVVKPWFAGRLEFAPEVNDLAAEGFPLVGGRLDYVDGRRVGAIVYKRRLHTISVFMWPTSKPDAVPRVATRNGYNLVSWCRHGLAYWAVSDLGAGDLSQLVGLL
jgi:anti-sigma factor RsiW